MADELKATELKQSAEFFAAWGLTRYGREPDDVPPKPKSASVIRMLGRTLEHAERERNLIEDYDDGFCGPEWADGLLPQHVMARAPIIRARFRDAHAAYCDAAYGRVRYLKWKLENSARRVKSSDKHALENARDEAERRVDLLNAMWPQFSTAREVTDANCAFMLADHAFDVAKTKFEDAERERQRDAAFNIVRLSPRRRPVELHL